MSRIVIIVGGPGGGKSTLCRALALTRARAIHLEVEALRRSMLSGFAFPDPSRTDGEWQHQYALARRCAAFAARCYADDGIDVFIDDTSIPAQLREQYLGLFDDPRTVPVLLQLGAHAHVERLRRRQGPFDEILGHLVSSLAFDDDQDGLDTTGWVLLRDASASTEEQVAVVTAAMGAD